MKKILFIHYGVFEKDRWGRTFPLAKAASKCGLETTLLTTDSKRGFFPRTVKKDGVRIVIFPDILPLSLLRRGYGFISFLLRLLHVVRYRYDYTYIDCGETPNAGWPGKVSQMRGAILMSEWGDLLGRGGYYDHKSRLFKFFYGRYYLWADLYFRKSANYVIVLSSMMKHYALDRGCKDRQIKFLPGGAIPDVISYNYSTKKILGLSEDIITLGFIGINSSELIDIMPIIDVLKKPRFCNKFRMIVFGDYLPQELIRKYSLEEVLISCGWVNYYQDYSKLQAIDIFTLMKSDDVDRSSMGWPNKLGDYLSIGRPIIISPYGDIISFVQQYPDGFVVTDGTPESIEEELIKIDLGEYNLKDMGRVNRDVAEDKISWEVRMRSFLDEIE